MSMHKLLAGDGYAYLTRQVAAGDSGLGPDDSLVAYYESTGNPPGRWTGHGLAGFGDDATGRLRPCTAVAETAMAAVFRDGCDPLSGDPLGRTYQGRNGRPVVGFDLTFTVPKSASVLWALGDDATRAAVRTAHRAAARVASSLRPSTTGTPGPGTRTCTPTSWSPTRSRGPTVRGAASTGGPSTRPWSLSPSTMTRCWPTSSPGACPWSGRCGTGARAATPRSS